MILICVIVSFLISTFVHEISHFISLIFVGLKLNTFNSFPISLYFSNGKYKLKIIFNLENLYQGFVLPLIPPINNKKQMDSYIKRLLIGLIMGPVGSFLFSLVLYFMIIRYTTYNLFFDVLIIVSFLLGVLCIFFSDGIMAYRYLKNEIYKISTMLIYSLFSSEIEINDQSDYLYTYANEISDTINLNDKFFYLDSDNIVQIDLQKNILYYCLVSKRNLINKVIIDNMNEIISNIEKIPYTNSGLFEYINLALIYYVIYEKDLEKGKRILNALSKDKSKFNRYRMYIFERSKYFIGDTDYKVLVKCLDKGFIGINDYKHLEELLLMRLNT